MAVKSIQYKILLVKEDGGPKTESAKSDKASMLTTTYISMS